LIRSFADLGAVWGVDGAYTFYVLERYPVDAAFLVDTDLTAAVRRRKEHHPALTVIEGNFGDEAVAARMGYVDGVILFDTLLHQVDPDWNEVLAMYAPRTSCFIIYNPQFTAARRTVRLLDLVPDEYFKNVPHTREEEPYRQLFEQMSDVHPQHQRPWRDIHNVWQWGIADDDLIATLTGLGFALQYSRNYGQFGQLESFENHGFVFRKRDHPRRAR
jgi:hypothetical protein